VDELRAAVAWMMPQEVQTSAPESGSASAEKASSTATRESGNRPVVSDHLEA
jgi:hypothetical protein